jgi:hypothetical protein
VRIQYAENRNVRGKPIQLYTQGESVCRASEITAAMIIASSRLAARIMENSEIDKKNPPIHLFLLTRSLLVKRIPLINHRLQAALPALPRKEMRY